MLKERRWDEAEETDGTWGEKKHKEQSHCKKVNGCEKKNAEKFMWCHMNFSLTPNVRKKCSHWPHCLDTEHVMHVQTACVLNVYLYINKCIFIYSFKDTIFNDIFGPNENKNSNKTFLSVSGGFSLFFGGWKRAV